ncbi:MAG: Fe-S cluster assembly scaffold protein NifU [Firmicutes bacterium]|nr:Fe-S cluster assembly scaffold protein NifU [Bacillota bacterium]
MEYSEIVIDHFMNPRNVGEIEDPSGVGEVGNLRCGDIMRMYLKVEKNVITDAKFKTFGCAAAIATSSIATTMIIGLTIQEALTVTNKAVTKMLNGLPDSKLHCSVLAEQAIKAAISDYYIRNNVDPLPIVGKF